MIRRHLKEKLQHKVEYIEFGIDHCLLNAKGEKKHECVFIVWLQQFINHRIYRIFWCSYTSFFRAIIWRRKFLCAKEVFSNRKRGRKLHAMILATAD